ncbi:MAG: right-handed parallel beta-helix repeat-containing protein [Desulfobaccales bacterium]
MSYVHFDDDYNEGQLTKFRERLAGEVRAQTGEAFDIFQDRKDIHWGQQWRKRLEESLDEVTFLIPILTPSFFKSEYCRKELERFLQREQDLNRNDLILPVYFISCPVLDEEEKRQTDALAQNMEARQYEDWRELRLEPFTNPQVPKILARMASQIREALERVQQVKPVTVAVQTVTASKSTEGPAGVTASQGPSPGEAFQVRTGPASKTDPPTRSVDQMHRGDHTTITEAIIAANPGDRIVVNPGLYEEGLVLDKPLEIVGVGGPEEVIVQAREKNALAFKTTMGRVANLALRQLGEGDRYAVDISQGRLELEDCDITSQSNACVAIHSGADPRLRRNRIHDGKTGGVFIYDNGLGTLEDNDIFGNALTGVQISGGNPTLRRNRIHDGKAGGVLVNENGLGALEDNDIFGNALSGVQISGGNPTLRRNRIHENQQVGVFIYSNGLGTLEDNDIFCNVSSGVAIKISGNPTLRRNRIHENQQVGVFIYENGLGTLEDNDIFGNAVTGVYIKEGGNPTLRRNRINKNGYEAVWVSEGGGGTIEDNDLRDNAKGAWDIAADCEAKVKRARNLE